MKLNKTTYKIFNLFGRKTIIFNNLYFLNGEFIFNGPVDNIDITEISTYPNVHYRHTNFKKWFPKIIELSEEQNNFQQITIPYFYLKESLYGHPGHTLMDDVFSVFYTLYKCKLNYNPLICIVDTPFYDGGAYDCKGIYNLLFGQSAISFDYLIQQHSQICFKTFIVGNSNSGFSSYDNNYVSPYGNKIWKKFRNAFYERAKIDLESNNNKIIYINTVKNKELLENDLIKALEKNKIDIVCWGEMSSIEEQLNILKNIKIYITTDGSCALNSIFLPDNSIVINLGRVYAEGDYKSIGYCEDYLYPALSFIDVLYFEDYYNLDIKESRPIPNPNDLIDMINILSNKEIKYNSILDRRKIIYNNFISKIKNKISNTIKLNNFSPNARLLIENYTNLNIRADIIKNFKQENLAFICNEEIRKFKIIK